MLLKIAFAKDSSLASQAIVLKCSKWPLFLKVSMVKKEAWRNQLSRRLAALWLMESMT